MKLFSFWRSLATYRVRIALNLKGLVPDEIVDVNLMKGAQREAAYRAVNPMMALPALIDGEGPILFESLAIIEYLDETHPNPPLLPRDARGRARVRGLAQIVACDLHPLIVPRVREYLEHEFKLDEPTRIKWCQHWQRRNRPLHSFQQRRTLPCHASFSPEPLWSSHSRLALQPPTPPRLAPRRCRAVRSIRPRRLHQCSGLSIGTNALCRAARATITTA